MKRKISLLVSCFACICMFIYGVLPVQAAICPHTICQVQAIPIQTGKITFSAKGHNVEYGTEHTCVSCGYRFFKDTFDVFEEHQWTESSTVAIDQNGNRIVYVYCETSGCDRIEIRIYY